MFEPSGGRPSGAAAAPARSAVCPQSRPRVYDVIDNEHDDTADDEHHDDHHGATDHDHYDHYDDHDGATDHDHHVLHHDHGVDEQHHHDDARRVPPIRFLLHGARRLLLGDLPQEWPEEGMQVASSSFG